VNSAPSRRLPLCPARFRWLIVAGCCAALAGPAFARWGGRGWGRGNYASTAQQGAAYGMAAMIRAQGYANLKNSEAAKNWEEAKTKEIDNRMKWTETYFEMRKTNREAREAERGPPITQEQAIRMARDAAPRRLSSTQLDPVTGHIQYPIVLMDEPFAPYRQRLDQLFAQRASTGGSMSFDDFQAIQETVTDFIEALKQRVGKYAAGDYGSARTFLDSLAHESRFPST